MNIKTVYSFAIISSAFVWNLALANPEGGQVVAGAGSIAQSGLQTTINQTSQSMVVNWKGFNTAGNETVTFNQPGVNSVALNRINSGLPTSFAGTLNANGKIFIVNPAGMVFTGGSHVNTSGLIATTMDIKDQDFMQGKYHFTSLVNNENARINNNGTLKADNSGVVALIAPTVINNQMGVIQADYGKVVLASGNAFVLDFNKDQLINFDANAAVRTGHVENAGIIAASNGKVFMTANAVTQVLDSMTSSNNINEASAVVTEKNGDIVLSGKINASKVDLNASAGIDIEGSVTTNGDGVSANTKRGNIILNNIVNAGNGDVSLTASKESISETGSGGIIANNLATQSFTGTALNSVDNRIQSFSAANLLTGDISLRTQSAELRILGIQQNGGNLSITNNNNILQDFSPDNTIKVTGSSNFVATSGTIQLQSNNQFMGPVSFAAPHDAIIMLKNSSHNIILDNISAYGLVIKNTAGSITQTKNGALNISMLNIETQDSPINLTNPGNKILGAITLKNSAYSNQNISLNNSVDTGIDSISAGGVVTISTTGYLAVSDNGIRSFASNAPNGHSIILSAANTWSRLYKADGILNPGENNSYLIYLPNPDAFYYSFWGSNPVPTEVWEQPYTATSSANIAAGNHVVYADKSPVTTASEVKSA